MSLSDREERLLRAAPKSVPNLVEFLTDYLQWPLPAHMEPEDVALIDWRLDDLHLDADQVAKLNRVRQLPKFVDAQPFGVFVLEFESGRLPVGAIRRVVHQLVAKKRTQAHVSHQQWALEDLLFFCQSHDGKADLHVVAFREVAGKPVMKVISWSTDSTDNRLEVIASHNLAKLVWPSGQPNDSVLALRDALVTAFTAEYRQGVKSADLLAKKMAEVARFVRDEVFSLYQVETEDGPLRELFIEVKSRLDSDLTPEKFADMYAQTMVYGLLTARITHPEDFVPGQVTQVLKFENPFLDALYSRFRAGGEQAVDLDEFGLGDLSELFAETDVDELLADFGTGEHREDPVVFFYEAFLEAYDPVQRKKLGAYYTPIPVVEFMVKAVDEILKNDFGLSEGIASNTSWAEYFEKLGLQLPSGVDGHLPLVRMMDPATGTGTFLLEWLRRGLKNLERVTDGVDRTEAFLDAFDAFEISLSSYSVANLKVKLELPESTRRTWAPNIRLTNTLQGKQSSLFLADDAMSVEGIQAQETKFETTHSIVIGNPPYLRADRRSGLGGWIVDPPNGGTSLFDDILTPAKENTAFGHTRSLSNLYVFFWRWAIWKAFEQNPAGLGVVAFITASSWLAGPGFMGLRKLARAHAANIWVVDLGGDGLSARKDENIFPIQTPVSIVILSKARPDFGNSAFPNVKYVRIQGSKTEKLNAIRTATLGGLEWTAVKGEGLSPLVPTGEAQEFFRYPLVGDLFPWQQPGCIHARSWPISPSPQVLRKRWQTLLEISDVEDRALAFATAKTGRNIYTKVGALPRVVDLKPGDASLPIVRYSFRSFDRQYTFEDARLAKTESPSLWAVAGPEQVFMASALTMHLGGGPSATCSTAVPDYNYFHGRGGKDVIALYRDHSGTQNVNPAVIDLLSSKFSHKDWTHDLLGRALFCYTFGILAGSDYSTRFENELQVPGPRIPLTSDADLFWSFAELGEELIFMQTFGERRLLGSAVDYQTDKSLRWSREPSKVPFDLSEVHFDDTRGALGIADGELLGVTREIYDFKVSGMPVLRKWLGYRTVRGSGRGEKSSSLLDHIVAESWEAEWSSELIEVLSAITHSISKSIEGKDLLNRVLAGALIDEAQIAAPKAELRMPPSLALKFGADHDALF